jgi:predicted RecA/RadA family phage recombinase
MINRVQKGEQLTFVAGANYLSGAPVILGALIGIVVADVLSAANGVAVVEGVVTVNKVSAQAWAYGDRIYWDVSLAKFTNVQDTDTKFAGIAVEAAANPTSTGNILLNAGAPQAAVIAEVATADGSDPATTQALANALKASLNTVLVALKNAGIMASA